MSFYFDFLTTEQNEKVNKEFEEAMAKFKAAMRSLTLPVEVYDIVQLDPERTHNKAFAGCLMVVTEVKDWGVQGYVQALGKVYGQIGGQAYYRAENGSFRGTGGKAVWVLE